MTQTEQCDQVLVVKPEGDIVASRVKEFHDELRDLVDQGHTHLAIDLAGVEMIDSKGLAIFILCHKTLDEKGGKLEVITTNENFKQLFHVMRMDQHFTVRESL